MRANAKRPVGHGPIADDRRRNQLIKIGLTAVVVVSTVALVLYLVMSQGNGTKPAAKAVRVTSGHLVTKAGTTEPKAVLSLYEDPLCPHCAEFDKAFGPTVNQLIDTGAVAADYYNVAILDSPGNQHYSSRASAAAYCVADQSIDAFRRFHAALYAQQPGETATSFRDNAQLIEVAREAGVGDVAVVADCINSGKYTAMVLGLAEATKTTATPAVRINGRDYDYDLNHPRALVDEVRLIVGDVPGLDVPAPAPPS